MLAKPARRQCYAVAALVSGTLCCTCMPRLAQADTGVIVYGSKGMDQRRTDSGHISLILTDLCAQGIDQVRECRADEPRGVVVTAYANLASSYTKPVFAVPLLDHFTATRDPALIPVVSSGASLRAAQITYWRRYLRPYLQPLSQQKYREIRADMDRLDIGRTMRHVLTLELIGNLVAGHSSQERFESIALLDPQTHEMIPNGRWREAVGTEHMRSAVVLTAPSSPAQELRLVDYLRKSQSRVFNAVSENCSDFVAGALATVYENTGIHFRPRALNIANVWITSPLSVATAFLSYVKENNMPLHLSFLPILAGTRRSHFAVDSISRGALVPDPNQGMVAFGLKAAINVLNPYLGLSALTADQLAGFSNLPRLIHDCNQGGLRTVGATFFQPCLGNKLRLGDTLDRRDRVRIFGTSECWKKKQQAFRAVASQAYEKGLLSRDEESLMLRRGQPFLLLRLYEHPRSNKRQDQSLLTGMHAFLEPQCARSVRPEEDSQAQAADAIPGRAQILSMSESDDRAQRQTAFKLVASVINFDLSSEVPDRRTVQDFDEDWQLFLHVAGENHLQAGEGSNETLEDCSCGSFDAGVTKDDALKEADLFPEQLLRWERELRSAPVR